MESKPINNLEIDATNNQTNLNHRRRINGATKTDKNNNNFRYTAPESTIFVNSCQQQSSLTARFSQDINQREQQYLFKDPCPLMTVSTSSICSSSTTRNETETSGYSFQKQQKRIPNSSTTILNSKLTAQNSLKGYRSSTVADAFSMDILNNPSYPLVTPNSPNETNHQNSRNLNNNQTKGKKTSKKSAEFFNESLLIHEGMERQQAEQLLKEMDVGDYLLRKRNEGNLALSLRSIDGNVYIKNHKFI